MYKIYDDDDGDDTLRALYSRVLLYGEVEVMLTSWR